MAESYSVSQQGSDYILAGYGRGADAAEKVDLIVYRFKGNGDWDNSFGNNGLTRVDIAKEDDRARNLLVLPDNRILVVGSGKVFTRAELIASAREAQNLYEKQVEMPGTQTVRIFGADTATVTALLWLKGKRAKDQSAFDYKLWFTDTYVRTKDGWRYAFGQASLRLPD